MSYLGESNVGSHHHHHHHHHHQDRTSSSSSGSGSSMKSSKKKKNKSSNSNSERPKQPQRGLGVAQLEKIRLHSQMGVAFLPPPAAANNLLHHHNPFDTSNHLPHPQEADNGLQTGYSSSPSLSYPPSTTYAFPCNQTILMSASELEGGNVRYGESNYPISNPRWHQGIVYEPQRFGPSNITRHLLNQHPVEDSTDKMTMKDRSYLTGSSDQNSDSLEDQDIDLELRLSL